MRFTPYYNPVTRTRPKRRHRRGRMFGIGATPEIRATFNAVKDVAIQGLVAAGSAVAVDYLFNSIKNKTDATKNFLGLTIGSYEDYLSRAGLGIVAAILYKKFIEKGRMGKIDIATALAIGPIVVSAYNIFEKMLKAPSATTTGLGYIEPMRKGGFIPGIVAKPGLGAQSFERQGVFHPQMQPITQNVSWGSY